MDHEIQDKTITAPNETVLVLNIKLHTANDLLVKWRNTCVLPELFQELVTETDEYLKGGTSHGVSEKDCKKDG